jgi:hypothetical protein
MQVRFLKLVSVKTPLGMKGFKAALDFGVGAGLQVTWKKEKE